VGGLIGKLSFDAHESLALPIIEQMLAAGDTPLAAHELYTGPGIALGWSGSGHTQPAPIAINAAGTLRAVADAQIANAKQVRAELAQLGAPCRNESEGELILRAYEQWGARGFSHLRGAFVCAIWDETQRRLVLARDHMGIRPLYFAVLPNHGFVFASDVRALFRDPGVGREWSPAAIDAYLALGYVPAPLTPYRRVSKLEAATVITVEGRRLHVEPYWDLPLPAPQAKTTERDLLRGFAHEWRRVIDDQTGNAGAAGILYSGGTASTALVSAAPAARSPLVTVAVDQDSTEVVRSGRAASMLGRTRELESIAPDIATLARQLAAICNEPVADPWAITQLAIYTSARRHTGCAFAAHGAATLLAGHARHHVERLETTVRSFLLRPLSDLGAGIGRSLSDSVKGARALSHLGMAPGIAYAVKHAYGLWDDEHRHTLYTRGFAWSVRDSNPFARHLELYASRETADPLDRALYVDARTVLTDSVLPASEHAADAAGVSVRYPFLDRDLVQCAVSLPGSLKQRGSIGMYPLRAMLARELPAGLMPPARRVPARHHWLNAALDALVPSILLAARFDARGIVSRPTLRGLWQEHQRGTRNHGHRLWSLVMLELWFRDAIDGNAAEIPFEYAVLKAA
jgi:asparagine synthase (glutamine-hydrolysing)